MSFQIKDFDSITLGQINHARSVTDRITDFLPGSVARTLMEAPAAEMEELYIQILLGLRDAIPVATFRSFNFTALPPAVAVGEVSVSAVTPISSDIVVPAGTLFLSIDGRSYSSISDVTWAVGEPSVRVPVSYLEAGTAGNIEAGSINASTFFDSDDFTISNLPITTGRDLEADQDREVRFSDFVRALSRGTVSACLYAARQAVVLDVDGNRAEYVTKAGLIEDAGIVRIFVYSSLGEPSQELLAHGQSIIDGSRDEVTGAITPGYRSAGVRVDILAMTERAVSSSIAVEMKSGFLLTPAVIQQLNDIYAQVISGVEPGATLYVGALREKLLAATGVLAIVFVSNANIVCGFNEALTPGALTITPL